jgi:hypothetical protein
MDPAMENMTLSKDVQMFSADIMEWKKRYRSVYYQKIGGYEFIYRLLTKGEYLALYFIQFHISEQAEDVLLEECVLYPEIKEGYLDSLNAGVVATLVEKILSMSGFSNLEGIKADLEKERNDIQLLDNQIVLMICKAFPHLTPSDIDNFDYPTIIHHVTLAEEILGTKLEISRPEDKNKIDFDKDNKGQGFVQGAFPGKPPVKK